MKKIFTLIAMAIVAIGANAQEQEKVLFSAEGAYGNGATLTSENTTLVLGNDRSTKNYDLKLGTAKTYTADLFGQAVQVLNDETGEYETKTRVVYVVGNQNPKDGELEGDASKGSGYNPDKANLPQSGTYYMITPTKSGHITAYIILNADKNLYVAKASDGSALAASELTIKADGEEGAPVELSASYTVGEKTTGTVEFDVVANETYYVFCTGSKLSFGGYVFEASADEPDPTPEPKPLYIELKAGSNIGAEVAAAYADNPNASAIIIYLTAGAPYTTSQTIETLCSVTIFGEGASIDASGLTGPMIKISEIPEDATLQENGFYYIPEISFFDVEISGLAQQLIYGNKQKVQYGLINTQNSVIHVAGGNKTIYDFNGGGVMQFFAIGKSTIYADPMHTGQIFSTQSGHKITETGEEFEQFNIYNNTFYNMSNGTNIATHRQNSQTWLNYVIKDNIVINTGKAGQFAAGWNGGSNSTNPTWEVENNASLRMDENGYLTNAEENVSPETAVQVIEYEENMAYDKFPNIASGNFAFESDALKNFGIGDPRWLSLSTGIKGAKAAAESNDVWYNLQGVRVAQPVKGVYISNGKKVVVK